MTARTPTRPLIRHFGGKWRLAPWIIEHFPEHTLYAEPYGGAASVLLRKAPSKIEVWNDLNGELVNLFRVLQDRDQARDLLRRLRFTIWSREENADSFLPVGDPVERARRYIVQNWQCIGHGMSGYSFRTTRFPQSNPVPSWTSYVRDFAAYINRFRQVIIESEPALDLIARYDGDDTLFYVDPPYPRDTREKKSQYEHELTDDDHRDLAAALRHAKGFVILSGYNCDLYRDLYADWYSVARKSQVNGGASKIETIWLNDRAADAQKQLKLFK